MVKFWDFIGKQIARLRFGVTYIQIIYYASVILGAIVLVVDTLVGEGTMSWEISISIIAGIFIIEWSLGFYTERKGVIKRDVSQTVQQSIPGWIEVAGEVWTTTQIPMLEEITERVMSPKIKKFMKEIYDILEEEYN